MTSCEVTGGAYISPVTLGISAGCGGFSCVLIVERSKWDSIVVTSIFQELKRPGSRPVLVTLCVLEMCDVTYSKLRFPCLVNEDNNSAYLLFVKIHMS